MMIEFICALLVYSLSLCLCERINSFASILQFLTSPFFATCLIDFFTLASSASIARICRSMPRCCPRISCRHFFTFYSLLSVVCAWVPPATTLLTSSSGVFLPKNRWIALDIVLLCAGYERKRNKSESERERRKSKKHTCGNLTNDVPSFSTVETLSLSVVCYWHK